MNKLEQAAREVVRQHSMECLSDKAVDALREALAERHKENCACEVCRGCDNADIKAEQAEQEPVVKYYGEKLVKGSKVFALLDRDLAPDTLLYAAPVRTKDLTDDEIDAFIDRAWDKQMSMPEIIRAVIAADREKNK